MIKIGITGGIGSGKSIVATLFEIHGIPVYNADKETKKLNNTSPIIKEKLKKHFGESLYKDGELDKKTFAQIIFNDREKLELANAIIHPEVLKHFTEWCESKSDHPIVALEAAILFESNFDKHLDRVVTIYSPHKLRVQRVSERDNVKTDIVESRIQHQMPEREKIGKAEYVIMNDYENSLIEQVENLIEDINHSTIITQ